MTHPPTSIPAAIDLQAKLGTFAEHYAPRTIAECNGQDVMVVKLLGPFAWHVHEDADDFFLCLRGALRIETDVDWHERHRLLKLAFAFDVHATDAAYETSFGHVRRATHTNTSWDAARYESCAHRYVHVGEPGFGVAVVNDAIYGHDVTRDSVDGRLVTTVRQSLLRAPTFPDPDADQGHHRFVTLVAPAPTVLEASRWGAVVGRRLRGRPGGDPRRGRRPGRRQPGADAAAV